MVSRGGCSGSAGSPPLVITIVFVVAVGDCEAIFVVGLETGVRDLVIGSAFIDILVLVSIVFVDILVLIELIIFECFLLHLFTYSSYHDFLYQSIIDRETVPMACRFFEPLLCLSLQRPELVESAFL